MDNIYKFIYKLIILKYLYEDYLINYTNIT